MRKQGISRDEDAVSAAVATVLLFGGVISIISLMLLSMTPVIQELEGAVKRHDMEAQMTVLAHEANILAESGMPGDMTKVEMIPLDGDLGWDRTRGGMWYSASWHEDNSFRIRDGLDMDRTIDIRHSESKIKALCYEDLRLGPGRPFIFSPPGEIDSILVTPKHGLTIPLGPVNVVQEGVEYLVNIGEVLRLDGDKNFTSSHDLTGMMISGEGGIMLAQPSLVDPSTGQGRHWALPLPSGLTDVEFLSTSNLLIEWTIDGITNSDVSIKSDKLHLANSWTKQFNLSEDKLVEFRTNANSNLIVQTTTSGSTMLIGQDSSMLSKEFLAPASDGTVTFTNPGQEATIISWRNGGLTLGANSTTSIAWPDGEIDNSAIVKGSENFLLEWSESDSGMTYVVAGNTGRLSGQTFLTNISKTNSVNLVGYEAEWNITAEGWVTLTSGDAIEVLQSQGNDGLLRLEDEGAQRCIGIDMTASGWIQTEIPWENMAGRMQNELFRAWKEGTHPSSFSIELIGQVDDSTHGTIATAWAFHLSRLTYEFETSISGLEIAWTGGAVVTNHPEIKAEVILPPSDKGGPGPRFSVTIPSMHPSFTSTSGQGNMELELKLEMRDSLASSKAFDLRRGWQGPYGDAIAQYSSRALDQSEDWIVYPGRLDLLTDYVGWVPIPSHGPSEAIWHTGGEPIQFSLQISSIDVDISEANS